MTLVVHQNSYLGPDNAFYIHFFRKIFFGDDDTHTSLRQARKICSSCPVADECLRHALSTPEEYGIWAGTSAMNRYRMIQAIESGRTIEEVIVKVLANKFRWRDDE